MIVYGQNELRRVNWFGFKPLLLRAMMTPGINPLLIGAARMAPAGAWKRRIPPVNASAQFILEGGERVELVEPGRCHVAREVYWENGRLASASDNLAMKVLQGISRDTDTFLDIGAYTGLFALVAAASNRQLKAVAYEILPENYLRLQANVWANNLIDRVEACLVGLSDTTGWLSLPKKTGGWTLPSSISLASEFEDGLRIPVKTLDAIYSEPHRLGRVAMKLDVEGFETNVIAGGAKLIAQSKPSIICEILPSADGAAIERLLKPLGYRFFQITSDGLSPRDGLVANRAGRDWLITVDPDPAQKLR